MKILQCILTQLQIKTATSFSGLNKNLDVSAINSGVYILKVTEAGKTATKKLVIR